MEYFMFLFLGILLYIIKDIIRWNNSTPTITPWETAKEYLRLNWISLLGAIVISTTVLLLALKGEFELFKLLQLPTTLSYTAAFLIGAGSQALLKQWTGTTPRMDVKGDTITTDKS